MQEGLSPAVVLVLQGDAEVLLQWKTSSAWAIQQSLRRD